MEFEKNMDSQARKRLSYLFDDGKYTEINSYTKEKNSLASVITAYGFVNGNVVYAFSQDKEILDGAVGMAHAEKIEKVYALATKTGSPVVGIHDSNGALVDGTSQSLTAYGKMINASAKLSGVVPQISVIAGVCAGSASILASSSDFVIMTESAEFFIQPNAKNSSSKSASENGIASIVCADDKLAIDKARDIITLMPANNLAPVPMEFDYSASNTSVAGDCMSLVNGIADDDSTIELFADYGTSAYTALSTLNGNTIGIVSTNKTSNKLSVNDSSKISRFVRLCDAFSIPLITFVDTEGFECNDSVSCVKSMTQLASCYTEATTIKISVITGKAVGPAFVALAGKDVSSDFTYAWENAYIAPFSADTAVEFLWHDKLKGAENLSAKRSELAKEYTSTLASAENSASISSIDDIIAPENTREIIVSALDILAGKRVTKLPKKHNNFPL